MASRLCVFISPVPRRRAGAAQIRRHLVAGLGPARRREPGFPPGWLGGLGSIEDGKREKFKPRPVVIAAQRFMEKDSQGVSHWFEIPAARMIQGLVASYATEKRLYAVTTRAPRELPDWHGRWPRLVTIAA
ncbi:MAG: hypothetical protein ACM3NI_04180 [Bacteroidota bacterium]